MRNLFALMVFSFVFVGCSNSHPVGVTRATAPHVVSAHDSLDNCGSNLPNGSVRACWFGGVPAVQACINGQFTHCTPLPQPRTPAPAAETSVVTISLDEDTSFCTNGGTPEVRMWDDAGNLRSGPSPRRVSFAPDATRLEKSILGATVFCRTGTEFGTWDGYVSPRIADSNIGSEAASIGVHVSINGEERPAFICWDTSAPRTDPMFHRIQFRTGNWDDPPGCYAGTS